MARRARTHDDLRRQLRDAGLRATPARVYVLDLLRRAVGAPISHGEAAEKLQHRELDRATVYRNLTDLADAGLARRTDLGDHVWRFEAITAEHQHPHFVCTACGAIECMPDAQLQTARTAPRAVRSREIEVQVRGVCDACR